MNQNYSSILVWNNIYIRKVIFEQLRIFNIYYGCREFKSIQEINNYKYKEYLYQIKLSFDVTSDIDLVSVLPSNVRSLIFYSHKFHSSIPSWIQHLEIRDFIDRLPSVKYQNQIVGFHHLKLNRLDIQYYGNLQSPIFEIKSNLLPTTLKELFIKGYPLKIKKDTLPIALKKLALDSKCGGIEDGSLCALKEFQELYVESCCSDIVCLKDYSLLPAGLKRLDLYCDFREPYGFSDDFEFPNSLRYLRIFVKELNFKLPHQLQSLNLSISHIKPNQIKPNTLPNTLKELIINLEYIVDSNGASIFPNSLERLVLDFNQKLTPNCLPSNLKYFKINSSSFNNAGQPLVERNIFPASLIYLDFQDCTDFNVPIGINTLPSNLKTLKLNQHYSQILVEGSVPYSLELLKHGHGESFPNSILNYQLKNQNTIVKSWTYDELFEKSPQNLLSLRVHPAFNLFPKELSLIKYSNLKYLDLHLFCHQLIPGENISINNSIETLILSNNYQHDIKLEDFKMLVSIHINNSKIKIITTPNNNNNNNNNQNQNQNQNQNYNNNESHNFYNLKEIIVSYNNIGFLDNINPIFYPFIKLIK